jgi:hypothetical protein
MVTMRRLALVLFTALLACRGEVGDPCEDARDCEQNLICEWTEVVGAGQPALLGAGGKRCTRECDSSIRCAGGEVCFSNTCLPECDSDDDCGSGETKCLDGTCALVCTDERPCSIGTCLMSGGFCEQ